jgi:hypothetical protein
MCYISKKDYPKFLLLKHLLVFLNLALYSSCFVSIVAIFATHVAGGKSPMGGGGMRQQHELSKNATTETDKEEDNHMFINQTKCLQNRISSYFSLEDSLELAAQVSSTR